MKKKLRTKRLAWKEIERLAIKLALRIKASGFKPDHLVGIAMGGLIPLALMARELGVYNVTTITAHSYDKKKRGRLVIGHVPSVDFRGERVLLVDEIADTGETLKQVSKILRDQCGAGRLKTVAFVVNKKHCRVRPDFSVLETDRWVVFPWDT